MGITGRSQHFYTFSRSRLGFKTTLRVPQQPLEHRLQDQRHDIDRKLPHREKQENVRIQVMRQYRFFSYR